MDINAYLQILQTSQYSISSDSFNLLNMLHEVYLQSNKVPCLISASDAYQDWL
jgi:hypothetical protein